ncbi:MAG TPA: hypothetical protein VJK02_21100 [Anaerolineales bacterium]|nr:hypothetical protein [Anaerolineales bacterium]
MRLMRGIQLLPFTRLVRRFGGAMTFSGLVGQSFMFGLIHTAPIKRKQHRKPKQKRNGT